jgi:GDPmannose 4,6-dehydratase
MKALITGITGQDGSYLTELLIGRGYEVHGLIRPTSIFPSARFGNLEAVLGTGRVHLHHGDLCDGNALSALVQSIQPDEIYNLGAQSHVKISFENPVYTVDVDGLGALRLLEAARQLDRPVRFYQASSSEMFGKVAETPQTERTPFHPRSPYACAKVFAHWQVVNYREAYGVFACNGILFNHESPRRGENFVTRKITRAAARIKVGLQEHLTLGNLDAMRDWGFAGDYVDAIWRMVQADQPDDFVIATGETHSVREFVTAAFGQLGLDVGRHVRTDAALHRPAEVDRLVGDARKAREQLGWSPRVQFEELVRMMVDHDLALAEHEARTRG